MIFPVALVNISIKYKSFTEFVKAIKRRGSSGLGIKSIWGNKKHKKWQEYMKRKNVYERYN